jgi:hypothetical protein
MDERGLADDHFEPFNIKRTRSFHHKPLANAAYDIRLLKLLRSNKRDAVQLEIIHTALEAAPSFVAVSYI